MTHKHQHPVIHHNESIGTAYRFWSPNYNIHFGYWSWGLNPFDREAMLEALNEEVFKALALPHKAGIKLLDAGCGTGATLRYLAKRMPQPELHGISLAPELMELGKQLTPHSTSIAFHLGDFQAMPFPDESFDAIVAMESVCYGSGADKATTAAEFSRVLADNGRLVVVDVFRRSERELPWPFAKLMKKIEKRWAIESTGVLPAFIGQLAQNGFEVQTVRDLSMNAMASAAHIPWVVLRLLLSALLRSDENRKGKLEYARALGTTLLTGLLAPFMGYYLIAATKRPPVGDK
ncbi:MAG: hypothetical protein Kow0027_13450 [Saprospiraceae bacterium]